MDDWTTLEIREDQLRALREQAYERFESEVVEHLEQTWPEECWQLGPPALLAFIRAGIAKAERYGLTTERELVGYLHLMLAYGQEFDTEQRWAQEILSDPEVGDRVERLWERGCKS